jgi:hypothetical protein
MLSVFLASVRKLRNLRPNYNSALGRARILRIILLMVVLGFVELLVRRDTSVIIGLYNL